MNLTLYFSGIATAAFAASSLFFIKFWRASRDRFFLLFAIACVLLSIERVVALFIPAAFDPLYSPATETMSLIYVVRLLGYVAIAAAIWEKNRNPSPRR